LALFGPARAVLALLPIVLIVLFLWGLRVRLVDGPVDQQTFHDLTRLDNALATFRGTFGFDAPSRLKLSETGNYNDAVALDRDSLACLKKLWPRLDFKDGIDWNGDGRIDPPEKGGDVVLEGDQCLVFFLGGVPGTRARGVTVQGFSTNPRDPVRPGGDRLPPLYEFDADGLVCVHGNRFPSYADSWGTPLAYFSSYGRRDGYNRYGTTDCPALGVWPYAQALDPTPRYLNPNTWQLVSAGPDRKFGRGTVLPGGRTWTPATADQIEPAGRDDWSDFSDRPLGVRAD
jgi:hypothetical protein